MTSPPLSPDNFTEKIINKIPSNTIGVHDSLKKAIALSRQETVQEIELQVSKWAKEYFEKTVHHKALDELRDIFRPYWREAERK